MGAAIAGHLVRAGWPTTVTDVDARAAAAVASLGATSVASAAEVVAGSDLSLVVVVDDDQVREVLGSALGSAAPGAIVAIGSSVRPDTCRELAAEGASHGVDVVDVALARGERGAEAGTLLLLCGGSEDVIDTCRPAFSAFATDVVRVGDVGAGQVAKTVNNILLWACIRADVEALRLGRALGVDPSVLRDAVGFGSGANRPLEEWGRHRLRWPTKDLEVALALAEDAGVDVPFIRALASLMGELSVRDLEDLR
jgi:3-hydroxyisobutyrate dehydrogenase-like beta-hydroxyacid dehydrogenase